MFKNLWLGLIIFSFTAPLHADHRIEGKMMMDMQGIKTIVEIKTFVQGTKKRTDSKTSLQDPGAGQAQIISDQTQIVDARAQTVLNLNNQNKTFFMTSLPAKASEDSVSSTNTVKIKEMSFDSQATGQEKIIAGYPAAEFKITAQIKGIYIQNQKPHQTTVIYHYWHSRPRAKMKKIIREAKVFTQDIPAAIDLHHIPQLPGFGASQQEKFGQKLKSRMQAIDGYILGIDIEKYDLASPDPVLKVQYEAKTIRTAKISAKKFKVGKEFREVERVVD